jgi:hypothetical protein
MGTEKVAFLVERCGGATGSDRARMHNRKWRHQKFGVTSLPVALSVMHTLCTTTMVQSWGFPPFFRVFFFPFLFSFFLFFFLFFPFSCFFFLFFLFLFIYFFFFNFFFKYGKMKCFYSVTQVTLDFKRKKASWIVKWYGKYGRFLC